MAVTPRDIKKLWGRAASHCSAPRCKEDLTPIAARSGDVVLGEMAHVIGRRPGAARSDDAVGADDSYENLILLCPTHHTLVDEAEDDYPPELLRQWKASWEARVKTLLLPHLTAATGGALESRLWTYFNFGAVLRMHAAQCPEFIGGGLEALRAEGVVDATGFPLPRPGHGDSAKTVFDSWPLHVSHQIQRVYSSMTEDIVRAASPVDLDRVWGIRLIQAHAYPDMLGFINRQCRFRTRKGPGGREYRDVRCTARGVELRFQLDAWNIYSNSSYTLHYRGASRVAAMLLIRSIERPRTPGRVRLVVNATPLALGHGFAPRVDRTPPIAWQRLQDDYEEGSDESFGQE